MFDSQQYLEKNYTLGPVAYFRAAGYLSTAEQRAIDEYKDVCRALTELEIPAVQSWAQRMVDSDFLVCIKALARSQSCQLCLPSRGYRRSKILG